MALYNTARLLALALFAVAMALPAGVKAEASIDALLAMDLQDLVNIKVAVVSSQSDTVFDTPFTVSVITRDMIQDYGFQTVAEAVSTLAGMSIIRTGARTDIPTGRWVLQDHYPNKVLVMINGVATWETNTGATTLGHISPSDVKRIEVLKGPASVLYGTNAYVGAINLVLDDGPDAVGKLYGGVGSYHALRGGGHYQMTEGDLSVFLAVNSHDEDGKREAITDASGIRGHYDDFQNYDNFTLSGKYGRHALLFNTYSEYQSKLGIDPLFSAALGKPHSLYGYLLDYHYAFSVWDDVRMKAGVAYDHNERRFPRAAAIAVTAPGFPDPIPADEDLVTDVSGYRVAGYVRANTDLTPRLNLDAGVDYEKRVNIEYRTYHSSTGEAGADDNLGGRTVYEYSVFGQVEYTMAASTFLLGSRGTENELAGFDVSSRAGWVYRLSDTSSAKFNVGESYRAPSLFELYFQDAGKALNGNPALRPETNTTYELAFLKRFNALYMQALVYHAIYDDKIYRKRYITADNPDLVLLDGTRLGDTGRSSVVVHENGNKFTARGLELETQFQFGNGSLFANYNYVKGDDGDDRGDGHFNFKYPPAHKLATGLSVDVNGWFASAVLTWYSKMQSVSGDIDPQSWLDLTLGYRHRAGGHQVRHTLSAKNATDEDIIGPDYVDRNPGFATLPWEQSRRISYTVSVGF